MKINPSNKLAILFGWILCLSTQAFSQTPTPKPSPTVADDDIIRVESRLIVVPVSVTDANG